MNDLKRGTDSRSFNVVINIFQLFALYLFSRLAMRSPGQVGWWIFTSGFAIAIPTGWIPRTGRLRWALAGASTALMTAGVILFTLGR